MQRDVHAGGDRLQPRLRTTAAARRISAYELRELGIDPYYFTLRVTIDNISSGHGRKAIEALLDLMPMEQGRDEFYRRVAVGYRLNDLGPGSTAVIAGFDLQQEVIAMLERKRTYGQPHAFRLLPDRRPDRQSMAGNPWRRPKIFSGPCNASGAG